VLKFLSVNSIVIAPASTGSDRSNRTAVTSTAQTNKGSLCIVIPGHLIFIIVVIKLLAPKIEDIPARCKENIAISTLPPACPSIPANGG